MNKIFLIVIISTFFGYSHISANSNICNQKQSNFKPIEPLPILFSEINIKDYNEKFDDSDSNRTARKKYLLNNFLPNSEMSLYIQELSTTGELSYLASSVSKKDTSYKITLDWSKYTTAYGLIQENDNNIIDKKSIFKIGIGARITINLKSNEKDINLSDIIGLGAKAVDKDVEGSLHYSIIGLNGEDVESTIPIISKLDTNSIENVISAIQKIKLLLHLKDSINVNPQIIAINNNEISYINKDDLKLINHGWIYFGKENRKTISSYNVEINTTSLKLGNIYKLKKNNVSLMTSYPKFPFYKGGNFIKKLNKKTEIELLSKVKIGFGKIWGYVNIKEN